MISSRHNESIKTIRRLRGRQGDHALPEGLHLLEEALAAGLELDQDGAGDSGGAAAPRGRPCRFPAEAPAAGELSSQLSKYEINTDTVQEALILASKVSSCNHVIAELCISDDPYYTTGYVASRDFGYVRIPHIKNKGSRCGGRAFFVREGTDFEDVATYLEKRPVIVGKDFLL